MGIFDFFNNKNHKFETGDARDNRDYASLWESEDAVVLGWEHVSATTMHIQECAKFIPSCMSVITECSTTRDPAPRYSGFTVPSEIETAEELRAYIFRRLPYHLCGNWENEKFRQEIQAALDGRTRQGV